MLFERAIIKACAFVDESLSQHKCFIELSQNEVWVKLLSIDHVRDADEKALDDFALKLKETREYEFLLKSLFPLVETIKTSGSSKQFLKPYAHTLKDRFERGAKRMLLFKEDAKAEGKDELTTLRKAFVYMGLFESSVTNLIDLVLMIFVVNHHDFYVYNNRAYARSLDDLDNASLGEKLAFLNYHDLRIFSQNLNKDLRNKVAHMDFEVNEDGTISVGQQKFDLRYEIVKLSAFVLIVGQVLGSCGVPSLLKELS